MRRKPGFWVLLFLVVLLCFLGYIQYRWIDRLARADTEREQQSLQTAVRRIAGAFDVEVTRAQMAFGGGQMRGDGMRGDPRRFDSRPPGLRPAWPRRFRREGPPASPPVLDDAFWTERAHTWWEFAPYARLVKEIFVTEGGRTLHITPSGVVPVTSPPQNLADPVLALHIGPPEMNLGMRQIVLDGEYIRADFLPRLARRYLDLERYGVRVASGDQVIFSRNDFKRGESTRMFNFRPECFTGGPMRRDQRRPGLAQFRGDGASFINRSNVTCEDAPRSLQPGRWTLTAGLTESAAAGFREFRTRSLLLSFGVLAVLATGIGMLGLYAHRAQILAQRQMEFAMAVSHELRTPLTVIRVAADSLAEGMVADSTKYGDLIRRETVRLSDMVEQVLAFARTQRADVQPNFEAVAPADVIDRALSAVSSTLETSGLTVEREVPEGLPVMRADANLLSSGLQNLLTNAGKYAASGGMVRLRAERSGPAYVSIIVQDNGPGVRPADLPRIFSAFYRASDAANSSIPGLGLGLHLVKRIVEAHGGDVRAANRGDGSGFEVEMRIPVLES